MTEAFDIRRSEPPKPKRPWRTGWPWGAAAGRLIGSSGSNPFDDPRIRLAIPDIVQKIETQMLDPSGSFEPGPRDDTTPIVVLITDPHVR